MAKINRLTVLIALFAVLVVPALAQDATSTPEPAAAPTYGVNAPQVTAGDSLFFIAFANTSIDSGPLDFYIEGLGTTPLVTNLGYGESTDVIAMPAGTHTVIARQAGSAADSEPLSSFNWDFGGNSTWVLAAVGTLANANFLTEPVTAIRTPLNGMARVRVVNWVADIENLSIDSGSDVVFADGLGWAGVQDAEIEPGAYQLQINDGAEETYGDAHSFNFEADTVYTLLLIGSTASQPAVEILTLEMPQDETRVRFVNERSDSVDIHMRPGDDRVASVDAGGTSDWFEIPSTAATFIAYAPGTGPTGQELASLAGQLRPGRDVTIVFRADNSVDISEETLTPVVPAEPETEMNNRNDDDRDDDRDDNDDDRDDTDDNDDDTDDNDDDGDDDNDDDNDDDDGDDN